MKRKEALVSTIGTEPQVVTLTLDSLLHKEFNIELVRVVHPNPRSQTLKESLRRLKEEFSRAYPQIELKLIPIKEENNYPEDFIKEEDVATLLKVLYKTVAELKRKGFHVHLSIAGGRKVMSAIGMVVAQLLFYEDDHVWHLSSEETLLQSKAMHADDISKVTLIPIPVLQWSLLPSTVREILIWDDPYKAIERQREIKKRESLREIQEFWDNLTPIERMVIETLIKHGGTQKEIASSLGKSEKTINNQLRSIYAKYRDHFGLDEKVRVRDRIIADLVEFLKIIR